MQELQNHFNVIWWSIMANTIKQFPIKLLSFRLGGPCYFHTSPQNTTEHHVTEHQFGKKEWHETCSKQYSHFPGKKRKYYPGKFSLEKINIINSQHQL